MVPRPDTSSSRHLLERLLLQFRPPRPLRPRQFSFLWQPTAYVAPFGLFSRLGSHPLTTDQGLRFRISDAEVAARLDVVFGQYAGTTEWSGVEHDLAVPPQTKLLQIQMIRQPSMKFDNKVGGTAWIDDLTLEPTSSRCSQSRPSRLEKNSPE